MLLLTIHNTGFLTITGVATAGNVDLSGKCEGSGVTGSVVGGVVGAGTVLGTLAIVGLSYLYVTSKQFVSFVCWRKDFGNVFTPAILLVQWVLKITLY